MKRVMVIGGPGSGKSTLAKAIGDTLDLPVVHMDALFWQRGWVQRDETSFQKLAAAAAEKEAWVIDGNYSRTMAPRLERVDTIVYLDASHWLRMWRVLKRRIAFHGQTRPDLGEDCPERMDWEFFMWCWEYERKRAPRLREKVKQWSESKTIVHLRSRKEVREFLADLNTGEF